MRGEKQYAFSKTPIIRAALHERTVHSEYVYQKRRRISAEYFCWRGCCDRFENGAALLPVLFVALYFLVSAIGVAWNAAAGRYVVVRAAAVACEEQRDAVRQKRSVYRFIPVDEDGNYLSEQGAYDIFLDFASKKKSPRFNFFIGRTYVLVFHIDNSRQLNERTLAAVYTG